MVALVERQDFQQENMEQWITFKLVPAYFAQTREEASQKKYFCSKQQMKPVLINSPSGQSQKKPKKPNKPKPTNQQNKYSKFKLIQSNQIHILLSCGKITNFQVTNLSCSGLYHCSKKYIFIKLPLSPKAYISSFSFSLLVRFVIAFGFFAYTVHIAVLIPQNNIKKKNFTKVFKTLL